VYSVEDADIRTLWAIKDHQRRRALRRRPASLKFGLDHTASAFFIKAASITVFGGRSDADGDA
jgi:hypothetical protein